MAEKLAGYTYGKYRHWEIIPGVLLWVTLISALVVSFVAPLYAVIFIIVFDLYWLFRIVYFVIYTFLAWRQYKDVVSIDWQEKMQTVDGADEVYHLVFLPTYKEELDIIRATLKSLRDSKFPNDRMLVVFCGEERDKGRFEKNAEAIKREFGGVFKEIFVTLHPADLPNEIPGKGSNLNWAGRRVAEMLEEQYPEIDDENIVVSSFDIDTVAHEQYFSYLTYLYCTVENPTRASYQPVALFGNNIWSAPAPVRIEAFGTTFWLMSELTRPDRLWTFSSHSMPWVMLKDVGFWQKDIVSEDSRIFLQAFLEYHGDYRVIPMHIPVSMDTVTGGNYWDSLVALYKQQRRWAWGVEHLPVMIEAFRKDPKIPLSKKLKYLFNQIEGMFTWATAPILIFVLGWLPLRIAGDQASALIQTAPFTLERLMQLAMIGVFVSAAISLSMLPPRPDNIGRHTWIIMIFQWALLPITFVVLGAFPAIDAQTRLMLGKYLGFNVTKKQRS